MLPTKTVITCAAIFLIFVSSVYYNTKNIQKSNAKILVTEEFESKRSTMTRINNNYTGERYDFCLDYTVLYSIGVFLIMFVLSLKVQFSIYNKRYDGNKNLRYFSAGDFQGLLAESIEFSSDKGQTLRGYLYRDANTKSPKALIIFHMVMAQDILLILRN